MIKIETAARPNGGEVSRAVWNGNAYEANTHTTCSVRELARVLVAAGCEDSPWQSNGLHGRSLHALCAHRLSEGDGGFVKSWWKAHPNAKPQPTLDAVVAEVRAR